MKSLSDLGAFILLITMVFFGGYEEGKDDLYVELREQCQKENIELKRFIKTEGYLFFKCSVVEKKEVSTWVEVE